MDTDEFESWFVPAPIRIKSLDVPNYRGLMRKAAGVFLALACVCGVMWVVLK